MGGRHYNREAIHKRLLDYDPGDISHQTIRNDPELPSPDTVKRYAGKSNEHISGIKDLKDLVAEDYLQVWQGDDESIEQAVEQAIQEIGEKPKVSNLKPYFQDRDRFPNYPVLFNSDNQRYSGGLKDLKSELEVTEENLRGYSDKDEHIEEVMLYVHDQLDKKAPSRYELSEFLKDQPTLLSLSHYERNYSDALNAMFEKHGKEVNALAPENDPIPLTDQDEKVLWGMMLGDGCCRTSNQDNNPLIQYVSAEMPQLPVLKEKINANIWRNNIYTHETSSSSNDRHTLMSKCLPNLEKFREPYCTVLNGSADPNAFWTTWDGLTGETFQYSTWKMMDMSKRMKSKKAQIPESLEISPELMMAWYLGDGTRHKRSGTLRITAEFPEEDYRRIQLQLEEEIFDGLDHPEEASTITKNKGGWSLMPSTSQPYTETEIQNIKEARCKGYIQDEAGDPVREEMIIDRKTLRINQPGIEAFFDYLPDHDDWDNVMPRKFPD